MNNQEIVGMNSAYKHAKQCSYGANMSISAALIVEMVERIAELDKERFTFKKIISNPAMADQEKYVHIRDMLKEQGE